MRWVTFDPYFKWNKSVRYENFFLRDYFSPGVIKPQCIEWSRPQKRMELQMIVHMNIQHGYSMKHNLFAIHTITCEHWKFYYENLISPLVIHNQMWYVTKDYNYIREAMSPPPPPHPRHPPPTPQPPTPPHPRPHMQPQFKLTSAASSSATHSTAHI